MSEQQTANVNWVQALAAALAAMTSAVLLSTVGGAGTIIGAAVGSVIATVGSAVYSYYLETSKKRVAAASALARERAVRARARKQGATAAPVAERTRTEQLQLADEDLNQAEEDLERVETDGPQKPSWQEIVRGLRWKRIGLVALGIFLAAMAAILAFELIAGRSVSTITGGSDDGARTSVNWGGGDSGDAPAPAPTHTPSDTPDEEPTTGAATPTASPEPTPNEETSAPPTEEPVPQPSTSAPTPALPSAATPSPSPGATP